MKYLVLVQARCGSSRLPGKVMKELCGKTVIERVVERVKKSRYIDGAAVITSIEENNLPMLALCASKGIRVFVGSENDVLDRYYQATRLFMPEYVIRITADCPLIDWNYIDMAIESADGDTDYIAAFTETFPDGLDVEIMKYSALKNAWENARLASEREHVTLYIRNNREKFKTKDFVCPIKNIGNKRWTLDEEEDYVFISKIYEHFTGIGNEDFSTEDILGFLEKNPELELINSKFDRNEGMRISLANDHIVDGVD